MDYPALFEPAKEGGFVITFPDFEWGITQGDTEQEGTEMSIDALEMIIAQYIKEGKPLPEASRPRGRKYRFIRLPALSAMKAELYRVFVESGVRRAELGRRLGIPKPNVDQLFDLKHHSRLDQIEAAFVALGKQLEVNVRSAA